MTILLSLTYWPKSHDNRYMQRVEELTTYIKSLIIQGATNVALVTLDGITEYATSYQGTEPIGEVLRKVGEQLAYARIAEPLAQNALRAIFESPFETKEYYIQKIDEFKQLLSKSKQKMAHAGASFIQDGGVYLTNCHSMTVVSMFIQAHKLGKKFAVYVTETRPLYQGRRTSRELLEAGIEDVTMLVDSAAMSLLSQYDRPIDSVFMGANMLTQHGFMNRMGSLGIAYTAQLKQIPIFCVSILLKYDPRPFTHALMDVQSEKEIWPDAPKGLKFYNPAHDFIPYETGVMMICENGTLEGKTIAAHATSLYPFLQSANW
jgi:translation initiation factor 2B subunit (eIF-2B alpha/beta/delta family)